MIENVVIDFYENIQIADFGIRSMSLRALSPPEEMLNVGTWPYAAPEPILVKNSLYGLEVDYWALGRIAFEMECWGHQVSRPILFVLLSENLISPRSSGTICE